MGLVRVYGDAGQFLGIAERGDDSKLKPRRIFMYSSVMAGQPGSPKDADSEA